MIERVTYKKVPCIVWDDGDEICVEYMLKSFHSFREVEETSKMIGFKPKFKIKDFVGIKWS